MTKEELEKEAEEYAEGMAKYYASTHEDCIPSQFEKYLRNAYISSAKLREKRITELEQQIDEMKWHDLEKDSNDLPENKRNVWCDYGDACGVGYYDKDDGGWWIEGHIYCSVLDAWCELPKRDKGDKRK